MSQEYVLVEKSFIRRMEAHMRRTDKIFDMLTRGIAIPETWISIKKFRELTGKTQSQVEYLRKKQYSKGDDSMFRIRDKRWQVNYKEYVKKYEQ